MSVRRVTIVLDVCLMGRVTLREYNEPIIIISRTNNAKPLERTENVRPFGDKTFSENKELSATHYVDAPLTSENDRGTHRQNIGNTY